MMDTLRSALESLPHGTGFRFIDDLVELQPGVSGLATYTVRADQPFLSSHFPGEPLFPGVLLVEGAAQLVGVVVRSNDSGCPGPRLRLTALKSVKILGTARPGQTIRFEAHLLGRLGHLIQAHATARVGGETILECELTLSEEKERK